MAEQWASSSNEALRVHLVDAPHLGERAAFHPSFTYPIFGEEETIYGYKDLKVDLALQSGSLLGALDVRHNGKLESKSAKVDDPREKLMEYLAADDVVSGTATELRSELIDKRPAFEPMGKLVHSYIRAAPTTSNGKGKGKSQDRPLAGFRRGGGSAGGPGSSSAGEKDRHFEIYHCDWNTPGFREYHRRMQLFALLFIEGASYIHEDEASWEFLVVYEVRDGPDGKEQGAGMTHHFVGYTSLYNFWFYPSSYRLRLSQVIVLPPYQAQGHGSELYRQVVKIALAREDIVELTIEDPSEAFDRLRDTNDLKRLLSPEDGFLQRAREAKKGGALCAPVDKAWSEAERKRHKIAKRQWTRLVEMCMLMMLDEADEVSVTAFRLQVKARLYHFNRDVLQELPQHERVAKLQETFESVMDEYSALTGVDVDAIVDAGVDAVEAHASNGQPAAKAPRLN